MDKKTILSGLVPFLSNPATLTIAGIGLIGWTIYELSKEDREEAKKADATIKPVLQAQQPNERYVKPFKPYRSTVQQTAPVTVHPTVKIIVSEPLDLSEQTIHNAFQPISVEEDEEAKKKEIIRQAMSELGKRSAKKRRKKQ